MGYVERIDLGGKSLSKNVSHRQILSDFMYLSEKGPSDDFCGTTCDSELLLSVLKKDVSLADALATLITSYWTKGYDCAACDVDVLHTWRDTDNRCQRIKRRYGI